MLVRVVETFADGLGRIWKEGRTYDMDEERGEALVLSGHVTRIPKNHELAVGLLKEANIWAVVVHDETDPEFIASAEEAGLKINQKRGG